ncbi:MAG: methyltransferase domain-containing protein [Chloroflexi bacterium]|nr:methyltransferase domain-containing protein [Chloroflexota bacterium]
MGSFCAQVYDLALAPFEAVRLTGLRKRLLAGAAGRVLEVGFGTGATLGAYPGHVELVALEPDAAMLRQARKRAARLKAPCRLLLGDAQHLPFRDGAFDTAVASLAFCTVPDPLRGLREVRRVLRPGGRFLALEHVQVSYQPVAWLQAVATPLWKRVAGGCHLDRHTLETVQAAGFTVQVARHHWLGFLLVVEAVRM